MIVKRIDRALILKLDRLIGVRSIFADCLPMAFVWSKPIAAKKKHCHTESVFTD